MGGFKANVAYLIAANIQMATDGEQSRDFNAIVSKLHEAIKNEVKGNDLTAAVRDAFVLSNGNGNNFDVLLASIKDDKLE